MNYGSSQKGFIALMSAIIISAVLMIIVFSLSLSGFITRFSILNSEFKKRSFSLAEACANTALLKKIQDVSYAGNEMITINGNSCSILPITTSGSQYIIESKASVPSTKGAVTNIKLIVNSGSFTVANWQECPTFSTCL